MTPTVQHEFWHHDQWSEPTLLRGDQGATTRISSRYSRHHGIFSFHGEASTARTDVIRRLLSIFTLIYEASTPPLDAVTYSFGSGAVTSTPALDAVTYSFGSGAVTSTPALGAVTYSFGSGVVGTALTASQDGELEAKQSPFALLGRKIDVARHRLPIGIAAKLKAFVQRILDDEADFREEGVTPNVGAFDGLIGFLVRHPQVRMPGLALARDGAFAAIWDNGREARIRLDFVGRTRVRWVIVNTGPVLGNGTGEVDQVNLDAIIDAYGAKRWMAL